MIRITDLDLALISAHTIHLWLPTSGSHWEVTDLISRNDFPISSVMNTLIPSTHCPTFPTCCLSTKAHAHMSGTCFKKHLKSIKDRWNNYENFDHYCKWVIDIQDPLDHSFYFLSMFENFHKYKKCLII